MPQPPNINKMLEQAQAMLAQQQQTDKQSEEAALKSGLEKSRHDAIMAIVQKIG